MRILVAVNRSPNGDSDIVEAVGSFPWPGDTVFTVLTIAEIVPPPPMAEIVPAAVDVTEIQSTIDAAAGSTAASAAARLEDHGFETHYIAKEGDPGSLIVEQAEDWGANLIVVGSSEKSGI